MTTGFLRTGVKPIFELPIGEIGLYLRHWKMF